MQIRNTNVYRNFDEKILWKYNFNILDNIINISLNH